MKLQTGHCYIWKPTSGWSKMTGTVGCSARNWRAKRREYDEHEAARRSSRCQRSATIPLERRSSSGAFERSTHALLHKGRPFILRAFTSHSAVTRCWKQWNEIIVGLQRRVPRCDPAYRFRGQANSHRGFEVAELICARCVVIFWGWGFCRKFAF